MKTTITVMAGLAIAGAASADMRITEWMYSGGVGEFIEFTNVGNAPIDLTGWRYDDDSADFLQGFDLSPFGVVQPGESVVITEATESDFRADWQLPASIKILGGFTNNLGRNDQINLFDAAQTLIDRLSYGDQSFPGTIRTQDRSGVPTSLLALGANDASQWGFADAVPGGGPFNLSGIAGANGYLTAVTGVTGNPGYFVPAPGVVTLAGLAGLVASRRRRA